MSRAQTITLISKSVVMKRQMLNICILFPIGMVWSHTPFCSFFEYNILLHKNILIHIFQSIFVLYRMITSHFCENYGKMLLVSTQSLIFTNNVWFLNSPLSQHFSNVFFQHSSLFLIIFFAKTSEIL